jgi:signal transduction histidine kinase/CHASE3 domain sensor protein
MHHRPVSLARQIALAAGGAIVVVLVSFGFSFLAIERLRTASSDSQNAEEVISVATQLERLIVDMETGERGYVITHETPFLGPWRRASSEAPGVSAHLSKLVATDPPMATLAHRIDIGWRSFFRRWSLPLVQVAIQNPAAARSLVATGKGRQRVESLRTLFSDLVGHERSVAMHSRARAASAGTLAVWTGLASLGAVLLLVAGIVVYFTRTAVIPIARVAGATRRLARGEQAVQVPEGGAGEVGQLAASFNDMAATLELRRAELESVLDSTADGLMMSDTQGRIVFSNNAMVEFGRSLGAAFEGTIFDRIASLAQRTGRAEEFAEVFENVATDPHLVYETEFSVLDAGRTFFGHTAPVRDTNGELLGRIFTLREVTAERESERLKDEFVATVSHELRTPLTSIRGFVELLLAGEGGDLTHDQQRFLAIVERNSERLLRLVGDLLLIAQLDAGTMRLELDRCDVAELAEEAVEAAKPSAEAAGLELAVATDPAAIVEGDRARLAQLVDNLLSNAIKFTPAGGTVKVSAALRNGRVVLAVADSGPGMSPNELPRLFRRFYRTKHAGEHQIPGTGLGLAISKAIAEAHGGTIEVASVIGAGTTFTVDLPRV